MAKYGCEKHFVMGFTGPKSWTNFLRSDLATIVWILLVNLGLGMSCPQVCECLGTRVDCSQRNLTTLPFDLPDWTEILNLDSNNLTNFDGAVLEGFPNLTTLNLSYNQLQTFPPLPLLANLTAVHITHNHIQRLESQVWVNLTTLKTLDLSHNRLHELPAGIFVNGSRLQILTLSGNNLKHLDRNAFYNLTALVELRLSRNRLSHLAKDLFKRLSALKYLEINRNRISKIDGLTFDGLTGVTVLKLRRNGLVHLSDGAFYNLKAIQQLQLDYNNVTVVNKAWLYGLSTLQQLSLSHNRISNIDKDAWEFCQQLAELDLTDNELHSVDKTTFAKLPKLQYLLLDHNKIAYVEEGSFAGLPSVHSLELNYNEISWSVEDSNGAFAGLAHIRKVGLVANRIKSIVRKVFAGMDNLEHLDLRDNAVATIQEDAFVDLKALRMLQLNTSSLLCDCHLKWFPIWLNRTGLATTSVNALCGHPEPLFGKVVNEIYAEAFTCDDSPKPYITDEPKTQVVLKGENVSLLCQAESTAEGSMTFVWKKDNSVMKTGLVFTTARSSDGKTTQMTSDLTLANVTDTDAGRYQCIVSNNFGSTYSNRARITVHVFPSFTKRPTDVKVKVGANARLECAADGQPAPEIAWKKDGGDVDFPAARERRMHVMPTDDVFFIVDVKAADAGVYSCTAENAAGSVVVNATLAVLEPPFFVKSMEKKETIEGETAVLECMAGGSPKPKLTWNKNGEPLSVTERHFFTADNQLLIIVQTRVADAGRYECEMSNTLGTERDFALLTVLAMGGGGVAFLDDESATTGIIIIVVVCCIVLTSLVWVIIIYQTRKRAAPGSPGLAKSIVDQPNGLLGAHLPEGVEFIAVEEDVVEIDSTLAEVDPDMDLDTPLHYPVGHRYSSIIVPSEEAEAPRPSQPPFCLAMADNSDSEQSSGKDSGTGDSAKKSQEDLVAFQQQYRYPYNGGVEGEHVVLMTSPFENAARERFVEFGARANPLSTFNSGRSDHSVYRKPGLGAETYDSRSHKKVHSSGRPLLRPTSFVMVPDSEVARKALDFPVCAYSLARREDS